jgi:hypothetical protein
MQLPSLDKAQAVREKLIIDRGGISGRLEAGTVQLTGATCVPWAILQPMKLPL